jgi:hypothetical protein
MCTFVSILKCLEVGTVNVIALYNAMFGFCFVIDTVNHALFRKEYVTLKVPITLFYGNVIF